ncbi:hypothetical protein GGS23DRAFT_600729 [Durotheca rogersii]|uniref:uncharacterized protein n=1 Tax=Durotheca rogersii TaxID=419775 RepID=UPI00221FD14D|nr:uncharacterized protein GGS23DRAFT_600729 [Durotheca rogersii]KAI5858245.1 hypothetical protein GGS23DRAFT_600729 [Durotheca rogersii]
MAQGNGSWPTDQYGNGIGGMGTSDGIGLNNFNSQQYHGQPDPSFEDPQQSYLGQSNYQYELLHGNNHLGLQGQGYNYYQGPHFSNTETNGSSIHGPGSLTVQQYAEPQFGGYSSQQRHFQPQYASEQPKEGQVHPPPTPYGQSWQQPLPQPPTQFNQAAVAYEHHTPQAVYPHGPTLPPYSGVQEPQVVQRTAPYSAGQGAPAGIFRNTLPSLDGQGDFTPDPPQYRVQQQSVDRAYGEGNGAPTPFGDGNSSAQQAFAAVQQRVPTLQPQGQTRGRMPVTSQIQPAGPANGGITLGQYQTPPTGNPATVPVAESPVAQDSPHTVQNANPETVVLEPEVTIAGSDVWQRVEGCRNLFVKNAPKTRIGQFAELRPKDPDAKASEKIFVIKHNAARTPVVPDRGFRLPGEIQRDRDELSSRLQYSISDSERESINQDIARLDNEKILIADESKPVSQDAKSKTVLKRKSPMDANAKKTSSSGDSSDEDESVTDITARKLVSAKTRPVDALKAVEYDVVKILWRDPKLPELPQDVVLKNIQAFSDYILALWATIKDFKRQLESPNDVGNKTTPESLQAALDAKYDAIRVAIETSVKYGDNFTITQLGIQLKMLGALCILLRHRFLSEDYNGPLPKAILKLLSMFITVDTEFLTDRVKFDKLRQKYKGSLDEEGRGYLDLIFMNAKERSDLKAREEPKKVEDSKKVEDTKKGDDTKKVSSNISRKASAGVKEGLLTAKASPTKKEVGQKKPTTEVKKMQPIDYSGLGSARKISSLPTKAVSSASSKRSRDDDVDSRAPKKVAVESTASGLPTSTVKPPASMAQTSQPPSMASVLTRSRPMGSMLPGRSRVPAKAPPKKLAPPPPTASAIGDLLAQISKPKETPKQPEEPERAPETPEERARRLRKESRRHLRVSWKPDHELVDIRTFEHDTAEDKGRDQNMLRDARDNRSEGQMLKQRVQDNDDEDEEEKAKEVSISDWHEPTAVRFGDAFPPERRAKIFTPHGGDLPVNSEQKKTMDEYENRVLMAIYTSVADIPESPQSPNRNGEVTQHRATSVPPSDAAQWQKCLPPTTTKRQDILRRWLNPHSAPVAAPSPRLGGSTINPPFQDSLPQSLQATLGSLTSTLTPLQSLPQIGSVSRPQTQDERDAEVLSLLTSDKVKNWTNPEPYNPAQPKTRRRYDYADPKVQKDVDAVEDLCAKFQGKPYPATEPPDHIKSDPARVQEWYDGYNKDVAAKAKKEEGERAIQLARNAWSAGQGTQPSQFVLQTNPYIPYQQYAQPPQYQQPSQQAAPDYAAIIAQVRAIQAGQSLSQPAGQTASHATGQPSVQLGSQFASQPVNQPVNQPIQGATAASTTDLSAVHNILAILRQSKQATPAPQTATATAAATSPAQTASDYGQWQAWAQAQGQAYGAQTQTYGTAQPYTGAQPQASTQGYGGQGYQDPFYNPQPSSSEPQSAQNQNQRDANRNGRKDFRANKDKGINQALIGTKPCTFWAKGQCAKGDKCTFRHDPNDLK